MRKQITQLSNLVQAIESGMLSISNVVCKTKASVDITVTDQVTPDMFLESIQFLNESTLFKNSVDFYYEFTGSNSIQIECGMGNRYLEEYFCVDCIIQDGFSMDDVESKLRGNIFYRIAV